MTESPTIPELLDLDFGDFDDDLPMYESFARRSGGRVLDLGAATGRIAIPLVRAGFEVHGIDASEAALERARCKARGLDDRLRLERADLRDFELGAEFGLVFAAYGTFHHLLTTGDQLVCLRNVRRHLSRGGSFVCDLRPLLHTDWQAGPGGPLLHDWTRILPRTGEAITKLRAVSADSATQVQHETHIYDSVAPDGSVRRVVNEIDLRFTSRYEMEALLREAGLELERLYGGYDLTPYNDASDLMITVARRGKEPA